jgi:hypothetical protein
MTEEELLALEETWKGGMGLAPTAFVGDGSEGHVPQSVHCFDYGNDDAIDGTSVLTEATAMNNHKSLAEPARGDAAPAWSEGHRGAEGNRWGSGGTWHRQDDTAMM